MPPRGFAASRPHSTPSWNAARSSSRWTIANGDPNASVWATGGAHPAGWRQGIQIVMFSLCMISA